MNRNNQVIICLLSTLLLTLTTILPLSSTTPDYNSRLSALQESVSNECPAPNNLQVNVIGQSVEITWQPASDAVAYIVGYINLDNGASFSQETYDTEHTFSNLPLGNYQVGVKSICDGGESSPQVYSIVIVEELDLLLVDDCLCDLFSQSGTVQTGPQELLVPWDQEGNQDETTTVYHFSAEIEQSNGTLIHTEFKYQKDTSEVLQVSLCDTLNPPMPVPGNPNQLILNDDYNTPLLSITFDANGMTIQWLTTNQDSVYVDLSHCLQNDTGLPYSEAQPEVEDLETQVALFPNPFQDELTISYELGQDNSVSISLYDAMGKQVAQPLPPQNQAAGKYQFTYTASISPGIYYALIQLGTQQQVVKLIKTE